MTPAIKFLEAAGVPFTVHKYDADHEDSAQSDVGWGNAAANALGLDPQSVFKTLVVAVDNPAKRMTHAVAVLPVAEKLDFRAMSEALGAKRAAMANPADAQRLTGYVLGGISPFGQKRPLPLVLHRTASAFETIHVSGGRRGLEIEIAPDVLLKVTQGVTHAITR